MKKIINAKMLGLSLATSLILASSITVQATTLSSYDYNNDSVVDGKDLAILKTNLLSGTKDVKYDVNEDGKVNILDYRTLSTISSHNLHTGVYGQQGIVLGTVGTLPKVSGEVGIGIGSKFEPPTGNVGTISIPTGAIAPPILGTDITVQAVTTSTNLDFNNNGVVDTADLATLATNYNLKSSDSKWDSKYDLNGDNLVDVFDLVKESKVIGTTTAIATVQRVIPAPVPYSTIVTASLPVEVDATKYKVTVGGVPLKYSPSNGKFGAVIYTTYNTIEEAQADLVITKNDLGITTDNPDITSKFTDANFKTEVYTLIGKNNTEPILYSDVKNIKFLLVDTSSISNLSGIENFTSLTKLYCGSGKLTALDVTKNTALTRLDCNNNQLITLDVTKNTALTHLNCGTNQLKVLDLSKNIALTDLFCSYNQLTTLYSIKDRWNTFYYKTQYTDSTHTTTTDTLVITIKDTFYPDYIVPTGLSDMGSLTVYNFGVPAPPINGANKHYTKLELVNNANLTIDIVAGDNILCIDDFSIAGKIKINDTSGTGTGRLLLYMGNFIAPGNGIEINYDENSSKLIMFTKQANLTIANGAKINGTIYAPNTDVVISGASSIKGIIVAKSVTLSNNSTVNQVELPQQIRY